MSLDRRAAERRRFARLLGTDDEYGSGLPIGRQEADDAEAETETDPDGEPRSVRPDETVRKSRVR
ncbi:hypothetical protein [Natrinema caseinilyticum]|uniref:hypothetical protein n=1 Tax=Natrinema caseinilyticum TaxID=2961570 RepID=UPI0020C55D09|nr:hypothetical protein [Natrinema caseinilyticum]